MKKLLINGIALMVLAVSGVPLLSPATASAAATKCDAHGIGNNTMTQGTAGNTAYQVSNGKATITFKVTGKDCKLPVTIIAWKAPNGTTGKPYAQQKLFASNVDSFSAGVHKLSVSLPDCYYQVDTVTGTQLTGSTGGAHDYDKRQVGFIHGGTTSCTVKPTPTPTPPVVTPPSPTPPLTVTTVTPKKLTNAGPIDNTLLAVVATSIVGGYVFALRRARR